VGVFVSIIAVGCDLKSPDVQSGVGYLIGSFLGVTAKWVIFQRRKPQRVESGIMQG